MAGEAKSPLGYYAYLGPNSNTFVERIFKAFGVMLKKLKGAVAQKESMTPAQHAKRRETGRQFMKGNVARWEREFMSNQTTQYWLKQKTEHEWDYRKSVF